MAKIPPLVQRIGLPRRRHVASTLRLRRVRVEYQPLDIIGILAP